MSVTLNGVVYTAADFENYGYVSRFPEQIFADFIAELAIRSNTVIAQALSAAAYSASAQTSKTQSEQGATTATQKAAAAALSAEAARAIVGIPPAYASLIMQPNRIGIDMTIPDGQNAVIFGNFEVSPDVTVTGLGNANFVGLG